MVGATGAVPTDLGTTETIFIRYDQHPASCMALEWCRRVQHFYDIYTGQDDPDFENSAEELESYEESIEFIDLMLAIPVESFAI